MDRRSLLTFFDLCDRLDYPFSFQQFKVDRITCCWNGETCKCTHEDWTNPQPGTGSHSPWVGATLLCVNVRTPRRGSPNLHEWMKEKTGAP